MRCFISAYPEGGTATTVRRVSVSLQPLGCRRAEPVAAGGQHRHRGVPHSPGHAERLHHGLQGDVAKPVGESSDGDVIGIAV